MNVPAGTMRSFRRPASDWMHYAHHMYDQHFFQLWRALLNVRRASDQCALCPSHIWPPLFPAATFLLTSGERLSALCACHRFFQLRCTLFDVPKWSPKYSCLYNHSQAVNVNHTTFNVSSMHNVEQSRFHASCVVQSRSQRGESYNMHFLMGAS